MRFHQRGAGKRTALNTKQTKHSTPCSGCCCRLYSAAMNSNDSRKKYKHVRVESSESSSDPESEVVRRVDKRVATARKLEVPSDPESDSATEVRNQSFEV